MALPEDKSFMGTFRRLLRENRKEMGMFFTGIALLMISILTFLYYTLFPTISAEIGNHQISSWLSVTLDFIGFGLIIYSMGKMDI